jgi:hypothetical protein
MHLGTLLAPPLKYKYPAGHSWQDFVADPSNTKPWVHASHTAFAVMLLS